MHPGFFWCYCSNEGSILQFKNFLDSEHQKAKDVKYPSVVKVKNTGENIPSKYINY